jgi:putative redox protein
MSHMVRVTMTGDMAFTAVGESGNAFTMDASVESGGHASGPTPVEALLASAAACSGMDVISILRKKQQDVTSYRIEISGDREPPGTWPRPFQSIHIRHIVRGNNVDMGAVARAVALSDEKYCTVVTTLRAAPNVTSDFVIESE